MTTNAKLKDETILMLPIHPLARTTDGTELTCDVCARRTPETYECSHNCDWSICHACHSSLTRDELIRVRCFHDEAYVVEYRKRLLSRRAAELAAEEAEVDARWIQVGAELYTQP